MSGLAFEDYKEEVAHGNRNQRLLILTSQIYKGSTLLRVVYQIFQCPSTLTTCSLLVPHRQALFLALGSMNTTKSKLLSGYLVLTL